MAFAGKVVRKISLEKIAKSPQFQQKAVGNFVQEMGEIAAVAGKVMGTFSREKRAKPRLLHGKW